MNKFPTDEEPEVDEEEQIEKHERRIVRCKACQAKIIFVKTKKDKQMPCDADTVEFGEFDHTPEKHISHFSTCPNAKRFRRRR